MKRKRNQQIEQETSKTAQTMSQQQYTSCYCFVIILIILCDKFCRVETFLKKSWNRFSALFKFFGCYDERKKS